MYIIFISISLSLFLTILRISFKMIVVVLVVVVVAGYEIPVRSNIRGSNTRNTSLLLILMFMACNIFHFVGSSSADQLLYLHYLHPAIRLLPYFYCYVLGCEPPTHANPALLLLYQMGLQLYV